jgi:RNA polymerase sigma factor (sigma-70 family)
MIGDTTDEDLIYDVCYKNSSEALLCLTERHSGVIFDISKKYLKQGVLNLDELTSNRLWIVYSAACSFNPDKKTKFSTWLANQARYFCLNFLNKEKKFLLSEEKNIDYFYNLELENNKEPYLDNIRELLDEHHDSNVKKAIYYRYFHDKNKVLNYSEIGKILKVTPQTVLNWHNKFIRYAKKKLLTKH